MSRVAELLRSRRVPHVAVLALMSVGFAGCSADMTTRFSQNSFSNPFSSPQAEATGSGYQAAILSRLCREVVSIERYRTLAESARARLKKLGCENVEVILGDGLDVPDSAGTFDRIIVTAAMEQIPEKLQARLEPRGILIAPVGPHHGVQTLVRIVRTERGFDRKELVDVRFVPALPGIAREL